MNRKIDPEFEEQIRKKIAQDNKEIAAMSAVKLLYHPMTILFTLATLVVEGGALDNGIAFLAALIIGYVASYVSIAAVYFLYHLMAGDFKTSPPEQYMELVWLMSKGYYLMPDEVDLRMKTQEVEKSLRGWRFCDGMMKELREAGYTDLEIECLRRGFIPLSITQRCGMGIASTYKRNYDSIWRWNR